MIKHVFLFLFWIVAFSCSSDAPDREGLPNIILINIDDLGYTDTELYGHHDFHTPHLLRFAETGMIFTRAYASAANCAPSRASMMTGQYTPRHGIYTVGSSERGKSSDRKIIPTPNTTTLADSMITLSEELRNIGYRTITIGKWHLGEDPMTQGFDVNIAGNHAGHPRSYFSPYQNPNLSDGPEGEYLTDRLTDEAISQISTNQKPFFLYLPYFAVHTPLQGKPDLVQKYLDRGFEKKTAHYGAMVENMDRNIGKLVNALDSLDIRDQTLVVFTSDNGGIAAVHSQRPLRAGKGSYYDGGIRVPLIFSWPGRIHSGVQSQLPVMNIDIYPTLLSLIGQQHGTSKILDGIDLSAELVGNGLKTDRNLYWHFPVYLQAYDGSLDEARDTLFRTRPGSVMLQDYWKIHHYFEDDEWELYNLAVDPREKSNLFEEYPKISRRLQTELNTWMESINAPIPSEPNPDFGK